MLLERLFKHVAQLFRLAALASNQDDFVAGEAFARSGQAYLESGYEFRPFSHISCCHKFARRILSLKAPLNATSDLVCRTSAKRREAEAVGQRAEVRRPV
jgi:hypothetical protein